MSNDILEMVVTVYICTYLPSDLNGAIFMRIK